MASLLTNRLRESQQMTQFSQEVAFKGLSKDQGEGKSQLAGFMSYEKQKAGPEWETRQHLLRLLSDSRQPTPFEQKLEQKIQVSGRGGDCSIPLIIKKSFLEATLPQQLYPDPVVRQKSSSDPSRTPQKDVSVLREQFGAALNEFVHQLPEKINKDLLRSLVSHLKILHFDSLDAVQKATAGLTDLQKSSGGALLLPPSFPTSTTFQYLLTLAEGKARPTTSNPKATASFSLYQLQLDKIVQILDQIRYKIASLERLANSSGSPTSPSGRVDCLKVMVSLLENLEALEQTNPSNVYTQVKMALEKVHHGSLPPAIRPITSRPQPLVTTLQSSGLTRSDSATKLKGINPAPSLAIPGLKSPSILKSPFLKPDIETLVQAIRAKHNLSGTGPSPRPRKEGGVGPLKDTKQLVSPRIPSSRPMGSAKGPLPPGYPKVGSGVNNRAFDLRH
jgi:hypothetical protein